MSKITTEQVHVVILVKGVLTREVEVLPDYIDFNNLSPLVISDNFREP